METLIDLYFVWAKMGLFTFGGGYAMLPIIQREIIEKRKWATDEEVMNYYAIGQATPGIIAVNTATFIGYKIKGVIGAVVATFGIVTPSFIIISVISGLISNFSDIPIVQNALGGIRVAVCCLMIIAILKLWKSNVKNYVSVILVLLGLGLSLLKIDTVYIVILAGVLGVVFSRITLLKESGK